MVELVLNLCHFCLLKGSAPESIVNHLCCHSEWQKQGKNIINHLILQLTFLHIGLDDRTTTGRAHIVEIICKSSISQPSPKRCKNSSETLSLNENMHSQHLFYLQIISALYIYTCPVIMNKNSIRVSEECS